MLAAFASFERDLIRERTGEGRKRAMAAGVHFGPKFKLSDYQRAEALKRRAAGEELLAAIGPESRTTLRRRYRGLHDREDFTYRRGRQRVGGASDGG